MIELGVKVSRDGYKANWKSIRQRDYNHEHSQSSDLKYISDERMTIRLDYLQKNTTMSITFGLLV